MVDSADSTPGNNGATVSIAYRVGRLAERQESLSSDIMEVRVTLAHLQEHLSKQDAKLEDVLTVVTLTNRLAGTLAELERRVRANEVRLVAYASMEEQRRLHDARTEKMKDAIVAAIAAGMRSMADRLFWPLAALVAGVYFNSIHAGIPDHVSPIVILVVLAIVGITWLLNTRANRRLEARTLAASKAATPSGNDDGSDDRSADGNAVVVDIPAFPHAQGSAGHSVAPDDGAER